MTRTGSQGLAMVGGFIVLLVIVTASFVDFDPDGVRGTAIGVALGLVNLAVGYAVTRRALKHGMKSAMATLAGGFFARLCIVAGLVVAFQRTETVDATAFALTFLTFFFIYLAVEMLLVERSTGGAQGAV